MAVQIRVGADGKFREAFGAEAGGSGGWFKEGLIAFGSAWGWTDVAITGLTEKGEVLPLLGEPGKPSRIANNTSVAVSLKSGARQVTVEGAVEVPPRPDELGTRPWAAWYYRTTTGDTGAASVDEPSQSTEQ